MTDQYRKLHVKEMEALYNQLAARFAPLTTLQKQVAEHVRKYYPAEARSGVLKVDAEYNDNTYDHSVAYLVVYNWEGLELSPVPELAKKSRELWSSFNVSFDRDGEGNSTSHAGDILVPIGTPSLPEIYSKD